MWASNSFRDPSSFYFSKSSERTVQQRVKREQQEEHGAYWKQQGRGLVFIFLAQGGKLNIYGLYGQGSVCFSNEGLERRSKVFAVLLTVLGIGIHGRKGNVFSRLFENRDSGVYIIFFFSLEFHVFFSPHFFILVKKNKCSGISISILWTKMIKLWWIL